MPTKQKIDDEENGISDRTNHYYSTETAKRALNVSRVCGMHFYFIFTHFSHAIVIAMKLYRNENEMHSNFI